jgi:hypothetical protein
MEDCMHMCVKNIKKSTCKTDGIPHVSSVVPIIEFPGLKFCTNVSSSRFSLDVLPTPYSWTEIP